MKNPNCENPKVENPNAEKPKCLNTIACVSPSVKHPMFQQKTNIGKPKVWETQNLTNPTFETQTHVENQATKTKVENPKFKKPNV